MKKNIIRIFKDFSEYPGLRTSNISDNSGEEFYHKILNSRFYESVKDNEILEVDLDLTSGYAPSFLDEAFGNLVYDFTLALVKKYLRIKSEEEPNWLNMLNEKTFHQWEERRLSQIQPKITTQHTPWYRFVDNKFQQKEWISPEFSR